MAELTTVDNVKAYLKTPVPNTADELIQSLINAVCDRIEIYCNREFAKAQYSEFQSGSGDALLILPNTPINAVLFAATGRQDLIDVTYTGSGTASIEVQEFKIVIVEDLAFQEIEITTTFKISDVVTAIDGLTNWTAAVVDADYDSCPAKTLTRRSYQLKGSSDTEIRLSGAVSSISLLRRADGLYDLSRTIGNGTPIIVIYNGGYATDDFPPALVDTATKMSAELFQSTQREQGLDSEKIGDYSWKATELKAVFAANSAQLDLFRRMPGTSG
jgi:hypothetical protein